MIYSFMFRAIRAIIPQGRPAARPHFLIWPESPCPSCTALLDQLDGAALHARAHISFVVVAKTTLPRLLAFGDQRSWRRLRLLSSAASTYNRDYDGETAEGLQRPMLNVFHRHHRAIRHFWGSELFFAPTDGDQDARHVGTIEPLWICLISPPRGVRLPGMSS